ncbi:hypothetical protein RJ640_013003 [Escallonia rubra]|uniref:ACB domain-containing protein n=1 Tax=Escallonia rubra TaxID=112253 RepID=A0AA88QW00_9ASTE|nr:hypothetical protein RJ640_013003 [Escallonia rubra]
MLAAAPIAIVSFVGRWALIGSQRGAGLGSAGLGAGPKVGESARPKLESPMPSFGANIFFRSSSRPSCEDDGPKGLKPDSTGESWYRPWPSWGNDGPEDNKKTNITFFLYEVYKENELSKYRPWPTIKHPKKASKFVNIPWAFSSIIIIWHCSISVCFCKNLCKELWQEEFEEYAEKAKSLPPTTKDADKLILYGLFKQATIGAINTNRPGLFSPKERAKWDSWKAVEGT